MTAALRDALASGAERVEIDVAAAGGRLVIAHGGRGVDRAAALSLEQALAVIGAGDGPGLLVDVKARADGTRLGEAIAARALGPRTIVCGEL